MKIILRVTVGLLILVSQASALQAPDLSPAALMRAFAVYGFQVGAVQTIENVTVRVADLKIEADGRWLVIRVLPRRVSGHAVGR